MTHPNNWKTIIYNLLNKHVWHRSNIQVLQHMSKYFIFEIKAPTYQTEGARIPNLVFHTVLFWGNKEKQRMSRTNKNHYEYLHEIDIILGLGDEFRRFIYMVALLLCYTLIFLLFVVTACVNCTLHSACVCVNVFISC